MRSAGALPLTMASTMRGDEGEWNEPPDVALDLVLLRAISSNELTLPSLRSFIQERARAMAVSNMLLAAGSRFA